MSDDLIMMGNVRSPGGGMGSLGTGRGPYRLPQGRAGSLARGTTGL